MSIILYFYVMANNVGVRSVFNNDMVGVLDGLSVVW